MAKAALVASRQGHKTIHFSGYSLPQLLGIRQEIEVAIRARQSDEIDQLRAKVAATANTFGLSLEEVMGISHNGRRITKHPRGKQPAKYRGPNGEEWSGRGPHPRWMKPLLAKGKTKEDFLIK
jgi:DNA-binding protein H-NS